ncbi:MAG: hypothetical protein V2I33_16200 [Kangiellaceae bacterium]|jgi:hypothetical protein|nr:hypothetical protein [Kangiellaceae bacterium]
MDTKVSSSGSDSWVFCLDDCPTGYTESSGKCSIADGDELIISYNFNVPSNSYINGGSEGSTYDIISVMDGTSGYPAKNRGIHFKGVPETGTGSEDGYILMPNFMLDHYFSIHTWILTFD